MGASRYVAAAPCRQILRPAQSLHHIVRIVREFGTNRIAVRFDRRPSNRRSPARSVCTRRVIYSNLFVAICSVTMHDRVHQQQVPQPSADPHRQPSSLQQPADAYNRRNRNSRSATASGAPAPDHHRRRRDVTSVGINGTGSPALLLASPNSSTSSLNSDIERPAVVSLAPDPLSSSPLVRYVYFA